MIFYLYVLTHDLVTPCKPYYPNSAIFHEILQSVGLTHTQSITNALSDAAVYLRQVARSTDVSFTVLTLTAKLTKFLLALVRLNANDYTPQSSRSIITSHCHIII